MTGKELIDKYNYQGCGMHNFISLEEMIDNNSKQEVRKYTKKVLLYFQQEHFDFSLYFNKVFKELYNEEL